MRWDAIHNRSQSQSQLCSRLDLLNTRRYHRTKDRTLTDLTDDRLRINSIDSIDGIDSIDSIGDGTERRPSSHANLSAIKTGSDPHLNRVRSDQVDRGRPLIPTTLFLAPLLTLTHALTYLLPPSRYRYPDPHRYRCPYRSSTVTTSPQSQTIRMVFMPSRRSSGEHWSSTSCRRDGVKSIRVMAFSPRYLSSL